MTSIKPWHIRLFGSLQAEREEREIARFQTQKTGELLGYLACYPRQVHGRDTVMEALWPNVDAEQGRNRLKQAVASLRRQLEPPGTPVHGVLVASRVSLQLRSGSFSTDVGAFEMALRQASEETEAHGRVEALTRAVDLFTGELLVDYFSDWVLIERSRLTLALQDALRQIVQLWELLAEWGHAVAHAQRLVAIEPFQEDAHRALIRLYLQAQEPGAALAQYQALEQMLREALGIGPSDETRALVAHLLQGIVLTSPRRYESRPRPNQAPSFAPRLLSRSLASATPSEASASRPGSRLPTPLTRLFGRESDLARLEALWRLEPLPDGNNSQPSALSHDDSTRSPSRLVTLTGPGGSGKTRMAIAAAQRLQTVFGERIAYLSLVDLDNISCLLESVAEALGLRVTGSDEALAKVAEAVAARPFLLILDNFEHLVEGAREIQRLLEQAPTLACLLTSRQQLDLDGEQVFPVAPLSIPPATGESWSPETLMQYAGVRLFVDRAQAVFPDFRLAPHNADAVATLCRELNGIPLAIELAAGWAQTLSPRQMVERLPERFTLLVSCKRGVAARHQTLEAAIEGSYRPLPERLQAFFAALSIFRGGWTLEAAEAVCQETAASTLLMQLRSRSLICTEETRFGMRFQMLESLREYGARHLDLQTHTRLAETHAAHYLHLCRRTVTHLQEVEQDAWLEQFEQDHENCFAALAWYGSKAAHADAVESITEALLRFRQRRNHCRPNQPRILETLIRESTSPTCAEPHMDASCSGV